MTAAEVRHRIRRTIVEAGYSARCACGWSTTRRTRELRDRDADAHETSAAAAQRCERPA